ncbi:MAG: dihydroxyacetone kinase subunit DhaL [Pseudomonadota bacterium]
MLVDAALRRSLIQSIAETVIEHETELTDLDQAIGDGDHGLNMKRGFGEVLNKLDEIAPKPLPEALRDVGMTLVMTVGGASGPLYGTLFMALGKELGGEPTKEDLTGAAQSALKALMARGKSEPGQKTMLDVLAPVIDELAKPEASWDSVRSAANDAAQATIPMQATKGRASFLGERSIGHMDPGARSSQLMIETASSVLETAQS